MTKEKRDVFGSPTAPNTRRRNETKTSLEENKSDETAVAVTTQESSDGIREKAMRIASIELETSRSTARWPSPRVAANDRTRKANELVRVLVGIPSVTKFLQQ